MKFLLKYLKPLLSLLGIVGLGAGLLWWAVTFIPFSDEEFGHYAGVDYLVHPLNRLMRPGEDLDSSALSVLGLPYLPWRINSTYAGSPPLPTLPILLLCRHPFCLRSLGVILLIFQSWLLSRLFRLSWPLVLCLLIAFMPYAVQHVVDIGGVTHYHTTVVILAYFWCRCWVNAIARKTWWKSWFFPLAIGFLIFWGIWLKLSHFFVVPSVLGLIAFEIFRQRTVVARPGLRLRLCLQVAALLGVAALLSTLLLTGVDRSARPYYQVMTSVPRIPWLDFSTWRGRFQQLWPFFYNPRAGLHWVIVPPKGLPWPGVLLMPLLALQLGAGIWLEIKNKKPWGFTVWCLLLFLLSEAMALKCTYSWAIYHVIVGYPFLVLAWMAVLSNLRSSRFIRVTCLFFVLVGISCFADLARKHEPSAAASYDYPRACAFVNRHFSRTHLTIMLDGRYTILKQLWGPRQQCVSYCDLFDPQDTIKEIRYRQAKVNRPLALVFHDKLPFSWWYLRRSFPHLLVTDRIGTQGWRVAYETQETFVTAPGPGEETAYSWPEPVKPGPDWRSAPLDPTVMTVRGEGWQLSESEIRQRYSSPLLSAVFESAGSLIGTRDKYALVFDLKKTGSQGEIDVFVPWYARQCYWRIGNWPRGREANRFCVFHGPLNTFENNFPTWVEFKPMPGKRYRIALVFNGNRFSCWVDDRHLFTLNCKPEEVEGVDTIQLAFKSGFGPIYQDKAVPIIGVASAPILGFGASLTEVQIIKPHLLFPLSSIYSNKGDSRRSSPIPKR